MALVPSGFRWPFFHPLIGQDIDTFFDNAFKLRLRDHSAKLTVNDEGFKYVIDASGYLPHELRVELEDDNLSIRAEHKSEKNGEKVERSFFRLIRIPEKIEMESLNCELDDKGILIISGKRMSPDKKEKKKIRIEIYHILKRQKNKNDVDVKEENKVVEKQLLNKKKH